MNDHGTFCGSGSGGAGSDHPAGESAAGTGGCDHLCGVFGESAAFGVRKRGMQHL